MKLDITEGNKNHVGYSMENDRPLYKGRLVIPHNSTLIPSLLHEFHDSVIVGTENISKVGLRMVLGGNEKISSKHCAEMSNLSNTEILTHPPSGTSTTSSSARSGMR